MTFNLFFDKEFLLGYEHAKRGTVPVKNPSENYCLGYSKAIDIFY
jgi:hypothetical protein